MSSRVLILLLAFTAFVSTFAASAQDPAPAPAAELTDSYRKTLSTLLDITGAKVAGEQVAYAVAQETLGAIAATGAQITEQMQQVVIEEAIAEFVPRFGDLEFLTNLYGPYYAQHLNEEELKGLLGFYESPLGQKTLVAMPSIAQAGAMALQQNSYEALPAFQQKVDTNLRSQGILLPNE